MLLFFFTGLALIITIGVLAIYSPLEAGAHSGLPGVTLSTRSEGNDQSPVTVIEYRHGAPLAVRFSVRNSGAWGVTITSIPGGDFGLFHVDRVRMGFPDPARCCIETQSFHSFALRPAEDRIIELHGRLAGCGNYEPGSSTEWRSYDVDFRVAGIPKSVSISSNETIRIEIPPGYACPEPRTGSG